MPGQNQEPRSQFSSTATHETRVKESVRGEAVREGDIRIRWSISMGIDNTGTICKFLTSAPSYGYAGETVIIPY